MSEGHEVPIDTSVPNVARVWNYLMGGKDNLKLDRGAADAINKLCKDLEAPTWDNVARENREFSYRVVSYLAGEAGIEQFIDIGSGLPSYGNVHDVAQRVRPGARTVYVDHDQVVLVHGRALLDDDHTIMIDGDICDPAAILAHSGLRRLIDLDRPVAVVMAAVLHLIPDQAGPRHIVDHLRGRLAPGSYLALTHLSGEHYPGAPAALAAEFHRLGFATALVPRTAVQVGGFLDGLDLVAPGLVTAAQWRPDLASHRALEADTRWMCAGVGRVPGGMS